MTARSGVSESGQVGKFGVITGVASANFSIGDRKEPFNVKNNTNGNITLSVMPAGGNAYVSVVFFPGWNVEIVNEIATNAAISDTDLSWGY